MTLADFKEQAAKLDAGLKRLGVHKHTEGRYLLAQAVKMAEAVEMNAGFVAGQRVRLIHTIQDVGPGRAPFRHLMVEGAVAVVAKVDIHDADPTLLVTFEAEPRDRYGHRRHFMLDPSNFEPCPREPVDLSANIARNT